MGLNFKAKVRIVYFFIFLFAVVIATRLFFIQIVNGDYYDNEAGKQYAAFSYDDFDRGSIYFTEKNGKPNFRGYRKNGYKAEIDTRFLASPEEAYKKLSEIIAIDKDFLCPRR